MAKTKYVYLERNDEGKVQDVREVSIDQPEFYEDDSREYRPIERLMEVKANGHTYTVPLKEALLQPDAAQILRSDVRYLAFSRYQEMPRTFEGFVTMQSSRVPQEEYLRDAAIGRLAIVPSGTEAPELITSFEGGALITNHRYAGIASFTQEMIIYDQIGKIKQTASALGRSARMTEEFAVYSVITTTGNFARTSSDNDIGNNTLTSTFNGVNLETGLNTISTMKDRKSGNYLGLKADTIIIGPRMEIPVKQLLLSTDLQRQHGSTTTEVRGTGTTNLYRGMVDKIIISPWFSNSYNWALVDSTVESLMFQTVEPFNVYQESQDMSSEAWLTRAVTRFLVAGIFGVGMADDRAWFYSDSTTAPTIG